MTAHTTDAAGAGPPGGGLGEEDAELVREFCEESERYFAAAEAALLTLERTPDDAEAIGVVFRAFHTVKGVASLLGLTAIAKLAHEAESFLSPVRQGAARFDGQRPHLALRALDMLRGLVTRVGESPAEQDPPAGYAELIAALQNGDLAPPDVASPAPATTGTAALEPPPRGASATLSPARAPAGEVPRSGPASSRATQGPTNARAAAANPREEAAVRVSAERLDALLDMVSELCIAQTMVSEDPSLADARLGALCAKVTHATKIVRGLQDLSLSLRMVPLHATLQKMSRVVRDTAQRSGKSAELVLRGLDTEVDRKLADMLVDPLVHMVRNAVDHGLEPAAERREKGKPPVGRVELSAEHSGGNVVIRLSDDGRGLSRDRISKKAREQGLISDDVRLSDAEIFALIFRPGFSTTETVTDISGRGVGMDVVKRSIEALSGRIEIHSEPGAGTTFAIYLPLTLAITDGMLVRVGRERYIIPTSNIVQSFRPTASELKTLADSAEMVVHGGAAIGLLRLHQVFGIEGAILDPTQALLVLIGSGDERRALLVDDLLGKYQVVIKSLGNWVTVPGVSGGAILADGNVGLIIDPPGLMRANGARFAPDALGRVEASASSAPRCTAGKHLTFWLGREEYAIPVVDVREIVRMPEVTRVPNAPPHLLGVANLRGRILPIVDLRTKLGMRRATPTEEARVIVVHSELGCIGLGVDRVSDIEDIAGGIEPVPSLGDLRASFVAGVGIRGERAQFLLDTARLVGAGGSSELALSASGAV